MNDTNVRRRAVRVAAPEVGPRRRKDQREVLAQHAVLGKVLDLLERGLDRARRIRQPRASPVAACAGSKRALKSASSIARDSGVRRERGLDERLRQREPDLPQVLRVGAQHRRSRRAGTRARDHEPVEIVVLDLAAEDAAERVLEHLAAAPARRRRAARDWMPKSCSQTDGCAGGETWCGRSSITLRPMRSSIGRLSDKRHRRARRGRA